MPRGHIIEQYTRPKIIVKAINMLAKTMFRAITAGKNCNFASQFDQDKVDPEKSTNRSVIVIKLIIASIIRSFLSILKCPLVEDFEFFNELVYFHHFLRNLDILRAFPQADATAGAMACLAQFFDIPVKADQKCPAGFSIFGILFVVREITIVHAAVVMSESTGNIDSIRAWHAILTCSTWNVLILGHYLRSLIEKFEFFLR